MTLPSFARRMSLAVLLVALAACDDDEPAGPVGPFDLTFTGDASFQGAHGDQEIHVVVVGSDGVTVASETSTVSSSGDPAFTFSFAGILEEGGSYALKYWIDSNFGGGTPGVCDPTGNDHQWQIDISAVADDVDIADTHRPGETQSVCDAFAFDLTFSGDASFQGAHGGQTLTAAVVRTGSAVPGGSMVVATTSTTVSGTADPAFSLSFEGVLTLGAEYQLHYWIDSNFGGGTEGVCDPVANDHQWNVDIGAVTEDVVLADTHRPADTSEVCSTFS
ncbi:MAG TPA: hypothetical protein VK849_00945 [Longimicrobiales bacterium]|nr:hypothetical protein [Longimicrobiales bacterium]